MTLILREFIPVASQPAPEAEQPSVALKPPTEQPEAKEARPKPTKVDDEESAAEYPVKEIGREALKKISRDVRDEERACQQE